MKQPVFLVGLISSVLFSCSAEKNKDKTVLEQMNLKSTVKTVEITASTISNDESESEIPTYTAHLSFSKNGELLSSLSKFYATETKKWVSYLKIYNDHGDVIKESVNDTTYIILHTYKYNNQGQKTKELIERKDNGDKKVIIYTYTTDGLLVKATLTNDDITFTREYYYDENGNNIKQIILKNGEKVTTGIFKYNENNRLISSLYEAKEGSYSKKLTLNEKGDAIKEISSGKSTNSEFYIEFQDFQSLGFTLKKETSTASYTYDSKNNWTVRKSSYQSKKKKYIEKRVITYY